MRTPALYKILMCVVLSAAAAVAGEGKGARQNLEFSLVNPSPRQFVEFVEEAQIPKERLEEAYAAPRSSPENSFLYALAYDYAYALDDLEFFYQNASDSKVTIGDKSAFFEYLDYLIRINQPKKILKIISVPVCYAMQDNYRCLYYLGAAKYLAQHKCSSALRNAARNGFKPGLYRRLCH